MRKVAVSFPASEQLLELVTLDVLAGRRSLVQARVVNSAFDDMFHHLSDDTLDPRRFGRATRFFFGLLKNPYRRIMHHRLPFGTMVVTVGFDQSTDECKIESVELV